MADSKRSITAKLLYLEPQPSQGEEKPYYIAGTPICQRPQTNEVFLPTNTDVFDLRGIENSLNLDRNSFEYVRGLPKLEISTQEDVENYKKNVEEFLCQHLHASEVHAYHHVV